MILSLAQAPATAEDLFDAARSGDRARVVRILDGGIDVNAKARYVVAVFGSIGVIAVTHSRR